MAPKTYLYLYLGLLPQLILAGALRARSTLSCDFFVVPTSSDTCQSFTSKWALSIATFESLNPGVNCPDLVPGQSYCVSGTVSSVTATSDSTMTATSPSLPSPTQPGLASNCNQFYLVQPGDQCITIEYDFGLTPRDFTAWNPYIDSKCDNLWLGYYVCVGVADTLTTTTTTMSTTTTTTTISTPPSAPETTSTPPSSVPQPQPQPQMPGIVKNCKTYYLVQSGDSCYSIERRVGITMAQFRSWNTAVDPSCEKLWLGYYVCVGV